MWGRWAASSHIRAKLTSPSGTHSSATGYSESLFSFLSVYPIRARLTSQQCNRIQWVSIFFSLCLSHKGQTDLTAVQQDTVSLSDLFSLSFSIYPTGARLTSSSLCLSHKGQTDLTAVQQDTVSLSFLFSLIIPQGPDWPHSNATGYNKSLSSFLSLGFSIYPTRARLTSQQCNRIQWVMSISFLFSLFIPQGQTDLTAVLQNTKSLYLLFSL